LTKAFYTVKETAAIFSKGEDTITRWCKQGKLKAIPEPYGRKMTYSIPVASIEALLAEQAEVTALVKPVKQQAASQLSLLPHFEKACLQGTLTGRPFSQETVKIYSFYLKPFLKKYEAASAENLEAELLEIPTRHFGKREYLYRAVVCFTKYLVKEGQAEESDVEALKPLRPKKNRDSKRLSITEEQLKQMEAACSSWILLVLGRLSSEITINHQFIRPCTCIAA
jgi:hypothetical protein